MKSTLVSFFNSTNIGDLLIGEMLENIVSEYSEVKKISYSGAQKVQSDKSLNKKPLSLKVKIFIFDSLRKVGFGYLVNFYFENIKKINLDVYEKEIIDSDLLVIGGGNMIFDLDKHSSSAKRFERFVEIAKKHNKKVFAISLGIGPFYTEKQERNAVKALSNCEYITFRDESSYEIFRKHNKEIHKNTYVSIDPVFMLPNSMGNNSNEKVIALNIINNKLMKESEENYLKVINQYINLADSIVKKFNMKVALFSTEIVDYSAVQDVYRGVIEKEKIIIVNISTQKELLEFYNQTLVLIGTRMHSMIIAFTQGIPVIGLSWQQKVDSMFKIIESEDSVFNYNEIDSKLEEIIDCCKKKIDGQKYEINRNKDTLRRVKTKMDINHQILKELSSDNAI